MKRRLQSQVFIGAISLEGLRGYGGQWGGMLSRAAHPLSGSAQLSVQGQFSQTGDSRSPGRAKGQRVHIRKSRSLGAEKPFQERP